jgi:hypothetical protein
MATAAAAQGICQTHITVAGGFNPSVGDSGGAQAGTRCHNQDRGPESPRAAAPHDRSSQAMPHFLRHAPAMCGRELGGASPRIYWMRRGCALRGNLP